MINKTEAQHKRDWSRFIYSFLVILLALGSAGWLLRKITWSEVRAFRPYIHWFWIAGAFMMVILTNLLRALRLRTLFIPDEKIPRLFWIISISNLAANLMPFRSGELALPLLLKRTGGHRVSEKGMPVLVVLRTADLLLFALLLGLTSLVGRLFVPPDLRDVLSILSFVGLGLFLLMSAAVLFRRTFVRMILALLQRLGLRGRLVERIQAALEAFHAIGGLRKGIVLFLQTIAVWLANIGTAVLFMRGVSFFLFPLELMIIVLATQGVLLLPITVFWGLGVGQGIGYYFLSYYGYAEERIVIGLFLIYLLLVVWGMILGWSGFLMLGREIRKGKNLPAD